MIVRVEEDTLGRLRLLARDFGIRDLDRYTRAADLRLAVEAAYLQIATREQAEQDHARHLRALKARGAA